MVVSWLGILLLVIVTELTVRRVKLSPFKRRFLVLLPLVYLLLLVLLRDLLPLVVVLCLIFSNARLWRQRYGPKREKRIIARSNRYLLLISAFGLLLSYFYHENYPVWSLQVLAFVLVMLSSRSLALAVFRTSRVYARPEADFKYPTVTLAIPARNETHALTDTLRSALASDYPKLEIIVLDDCSQDSTPDIIKSFAHDGVRFIQGQAPNEGWIGKNKAYEQLLSEASGELILFAGVDVRVSNGSIRDLVHAFYKRPTVLLSSMPVRREFDLWPNLIRPLRYYWQLAFSVWPYIESCWLVDRDWLLNQGGFTRWKNQIRPGRILAQKARQQKKYRFVVSDRTSPVTTRKRAASLYQTAIRTMYPAVKKEPVLVVMSLLAISTVIGLFVFSWLAQPALEIYLLRISSLIFILSFLVSELTLQGMRGLLSVWFIASNLISEGVLLLVSALQYEFGNVNWKGRNICLPVMRQRPRERA